MRRLVVTLLAATATAVLLMSAPTTAGAATEGPGACSAGWAGPGEGMWSVASNWSPPVVPGPTTVVCIASGTSPKIHVAADTSVQGLQAGTGTFQVGAGATLSVVDLSITGGALSGPGTVLSTGARMTADSMTLRDAVTLRRDSAPDYGETVLYGALNLYGGSSFVATHGHGFGIQLHVRDMDGNPANRMVLGAGADWEFRDTSVIDARLTLDNAAITVDFRRTTLTVNHLDRFGPDGVLGAAGESPATITSYGTLVLPRTLTAVVGATSVFFKGSVLTPDGAPALTALTRIESSVEIGGPLTLAAPLLVTGRSAVFDVSLFTAVQVPAVTVRGGGRLEVDYDATLGLTDGAAVVDDGGASITGRVDGRLQLDRSTLAFEGGRVTTLGLVGTDSTSLCVGCKLRTAVTGKAWLAGPVSVLVKGTAPRVGDRYTIFSAAGGVSGTFGAATLTNPGGHLGVALSYTPTTVVATIVRVA